MNKYNKYLELLLIFFIIMIYNIFFVKVDYDEIWCYGFIYNVVNGLVPYKDFNLIVGPFYPYFFCMFLFVFGKNVLVYEVVNAILFTFMFWFIKKINNNSYYIVFSILFIFSKPNYNFVCLFLLYIILYLEKNTNRNYLIGFLIGLIFLTKFNVGVFLLIPSLFIKNKNYIIKRLFSFSLVVFGMLLFLQLQNSLFDYVNYCFFGMFDFANKNFGFTVFGYFVIAEIIIIFYLIFIKKEANIHLLYCLFFLILSYPILEVFHVLVASVPFLGYILNKINININVFRYCFYLFILYFFMFCYFTVCKYDLYFDKESTYMKYRLADSKFIGDIKYIVCYIKNIKNKTVIYIFDYSSYILKMDSDISINKYDLVNNGNMGYNGSKRYIEEISNYCKDNKCTFLLNNELLNSRDTQVNRDIIKYVVDNYRFKEELVFLDVYEN